MAITPGILYLGDYQSQGTGEGASGLSVSYAADLSTKLTDIRDRGIGRLVPDNAADGNPTADSISCWPWYDIGADDYANTLVVTSSTATTATVTLGGVSPGWDTDEHQGRFFSVCNLTPFAGAGFQTRRVIASNVGDTVTFSTGAIPAVGAAAHVGVGKFTDYHCAAGHLAPNEFGVKVSTRGGGSVMALGAGLGPDATLVRRLFEDVYDEAPYFHLVKWANIDGVVDAWRASPDNAGRDRFLAELPRIVAAATARGNTIRWGHVVIDQSLLDVMAAIVTPAKILLYEAALRSMIAWLRSAAVLNNPNLVVHLVNHAETFYTSTGAGAVPFIRAVHRAIAADTANVRIIDLNGYRVATFNQAGATEAKFYAQHEYFRIGEEMADSIRRANLGITATAANSVPVYVLIGDSIAAGPATTTWVSGSNSQRISGPTPGSLVRPSNQQTYVRSTRSIDTYTPGTNSNTSGTVNAQSGPELSIHAVLGDLHPDGYVLVKRAANSSALQTPLTAYNPGTGAGGSWVPGAGEHYQEIVSDVLGCFSEINAEGRQAEMRGLMVNLGTNDCQQRVGVDGAGAAFASAVRPFCESLRADLTTRTSGPGFPIAWARPMTTTANANQVETLAARAGLAAYATTDSKFRVVDVDDLEVDRSDRLHDTPDSSVERGDRLAAAMLAVALV